MGSVVIVQVQPVGVGAYSGLVREVGRGVGPFGDEGPVEPFDLAVGLAAAGTGSPVADAGIGQGPGELA